MDSSAGNSKEAVIEANVTQLEGYVCGLDINNFKLNTLKAPYYGQKVAINSVRSSAVAIGHPHAPCYYSIRIAPETNQGGQFTWGKGTYSLKLNYINNGRQLAYQTFKLTVT